MSDGIEETDYRRQTLEQENAALRAKVEALEKENFHLAAITCESPYGDEGGSKRCKTIDTLTAERDRLRLALMYLAELGGGRSEGNCYAQAALRGEGG